MHWERARKSQRALHVNDGPAVRVDSIVSDQFLISETIFKATVFTYQQNYAINPN